MSPWAKGVLAAAAAGLLAAVGVAKIYLTLAKEFPVSPLLAPANNEPPASGSPPLLTARPAVDPELAGIRVTVSASSASHLELEASVESIDCTEYRMGAATAHTDTERISRVFEFCTPGPIALSGLSEDRSELVLSAFEDEAANAASGMGEDYSPVRHKLLRAFGSAAGQPVTLVVGAVGAELCSDTDCTASSETLSIGASLAESGGISLPVAGVSGATAAASLN